MKQQSNLMHALNLVLTHLIAVVVCLVITFSTIAISENGIYLFFVELIVLYTYWTIIIARPYKIGFDDLNRVNFKRREKDILRGFKIGGITFIFLAIQIFFVILFKLEIIPDFFFVYKILNPHLLIPMNFLDNTALAVDVAWTQLILMFSLQLITPIFVGIGYILGYKNIVFMDKLIYKSNKDKNDSRKA